MFAEIALSMPKIARRDRRAALDYAILAEWLLLAAALVIGLLSAADVGTTVDEFNTEPYGHQALAWYLSGFIDHALFHNVEVIHLYGPWFQILTAIAQSASPLDPLTMRHALTFAVGMLGIAAVGPMARLLVGRWAGVTAIVLCLTTGYLYGHLFFSPIDVPFLAAMTWATLAIVVVTRRPLPSWRGVAAVGLLLGLALGTRPGGVIAQFYFLGAITLCAIEIALRDRRPAATLARLAVRALAALVLAWLTACAIWPWLQIGEPFGQFWQAFTFFTGIALPFTFQHWGNPVSTDALPWHYIPGQLAARLPEPFLVLLLLSALLAAARGAQFVAAAWRRAARRGLAALRAPLLALASSRAVLVLAVATLAPPLMVVVFGSTIYDGIRHVLFVIPLLAVIASWSFVRLLPLLRRIPVLAAAGVAAYVAASAATLAALHPLEYVAMNALAGGTNGAYGRFELDYWGAAATPAIRRLEARIDAAPPARPPRVMVCIGWREHMVAPLLRPSWVVATTPREADYLIETERFPCAEGTGAALIDEVSRAGRSFARIYATRTAPH